MVPKELVDGDYDEVYDIFLEDRARTIFEFIKNVTMSARETPASEIESL